MRLILKTTIAIALIAASVLEANAECVENAFNRPGTNNGYPTGCFVKPVPVEPSNCIAWDSYEKTKCLKYRDEDVEGMVPGEALDEEEVLIIKNEAFHLNGQTYKDHWEEAARQLCKKELAELDFAYGWYLENYGEGHGATQVFKYRLTAKERECELLKKAGE